MSVVSLDYDGVVTHNPQLWVNVAKMLHKFGDEVICVTSRRDNHENREELKRVLPEWVRVIFTNHNPKKSFVERRGVFIDIWIDDNPSALFNSDDPEKQVPDLTHMVTGYGVPKRFNEGSNNPVPPVNLPVPVKEWLDSLNSQ